MTQLIAYVLQYASYKRWSLKLKTIMLIDSDRRSRND
jgi:hypothetical protein